MKFSIVEFLAKLPLPPTDKWKEGVWDVEPFEKDGIRLVFFAPKGTDHQTYHDENEIYFIVRGHAELVIGNERFEARVSDAFFVPARKPHHFENISEDFATWAVFFSPM